MDIQAAKKRCEAATPEPWSADNPDNRLVAGSQGFWVADCGMSMRPCADRDFIAHARSDLPAALEALEEAQGKLRHQEPMIEWYKVMVEWFSHYVRSGESNQELLPRLDRILSRD